MLIIFIRTTIIFITLLILMRLMGKRQIGEMQPFELVITLVIAELACIPMADISIPLIYGIVAILALFILHQAVSLLEQGGLFIKRMVSGKPSLVLGPDGIDYKELKRNNLDVEDLIESMRAGGYFSLDDLKYGIFEANGKFSALESEKAENSQPMLPLLMINDGKMNHKNLELIGKDEQWLAQILKKQGASGYKNVLVMTLDSSGKIYLQEKGKKYSTFNIQPEGWKQW